MTSVLPVFGNPGVFINQKPPSCSGCEQAAMGRGFCPDWISPTAKVAFLAERPDQNEILDRTPLAGSAGKAFLHHFVHRLGYTQGDINFSYILRCTDDLGKYAKGPERYGAERHCRCYDTGLDTFNPDHYVITLRPDTIYKTWSLLRVLQNDIEKAFRLAQQGARPIVLLGEVSKRLVLPGIEAGVSKWRGHHGDLDWNAFRVRLGRDVKHPDWGCLHGD